MRDGFALFNHREAVTSTQLAHTSSDAEAAARRRDGFTFFKHRGALTTTHLAHTSSDTEAAARQDTTARRVHTLQTQMGPDNDATSSHLFRHRGDRTTGYDNMQVTLFRHRESPGTNATISNLVDHKAATHCQWSYNT